MNAGFFGENNSVLEFADSDSDDDEKELSIEIKHGPKLSENVMLRLGRNDPCVQSLRASWEDKGYINDVDWKEASRSCIGANTQLKKLKLEIRESFIANEFGPVYKIDDPEVKENFEAFCKGLALNRSIERLHISMCRCMPEVLDILAPFIEHNPNLCHFVLEHCHMDNDTTQLLAQALSNRCNKSSLRRVELTSCKLSGQVLGLLISSLKDYCNLVKLDVGGNELGSSGFVSLGKLIQNPLSRVEDLRVGANDIDDEFIGILTKALMTDSKLKKLSLSSNNDITAVGWRLFSAALRPPGCMALVSLNLSETGIDNEGIESIAEALATNRTLKILDLSYVERISPEGWEAFSNKIRNPASALEEINLSENEGIDDDAAVAMANSLATFPRLQVLRIDENINIQRQGWLAISSLLQGCRTLVKLDLSSNEIGDWEAMCLAHALKFNQSLRVLNLPSNRSIGTAGWRAFAAFLQDSMVEVLDLCLNRMDDEAVATLVHAFSNMRALKCLKFSALEPRLSSSGCFAIETLLSRPNLALEKVDLSANLINGEAAAAFAHVLEASNNSTLKVLNLDSNRICDVGWQAFSRLVCNKTSIMDTYSSNHEIQYLLCPHNSNPPRDLLHLLELNKRDNKNEVARLKILWAHFHKENINVQEFLSLQLNVLPSAVAWIGKDDMGRSLLYQLVRRVPSLFAAVDKGGKSLSSGMKRKIEITELHNTPLAILASLACM